MTIQENQLTVEQAAQKLSISELDGLVHRLSDFFHTRWDKQIERDLDAGKLDDLLDELENEYDLGLTKPL